MLQEHAVEEVVIKKAKIDKNVIPLVNWLNSFLGVTTQYCCEGYCQDERDDWEWSSYILFYCDDNWSLMKVLREFQHFADCRKARCELDFRPHLNHPIRYEFRFIDRHTMLDFIKYMNTKDESLLVEDFRERRVND